MTKKKFYFLLSTFYFLLLFVPFVGFAAVPSLWPTGFWGPLVSCTGNYLGSGPQCTSLCDLLQTFINIIYFGMSVAIFIIAPIGVAWGGILIMIAGANEGMLARGKEILKFTVIGIAIILVSFLLVSTFIQVIGVKSGLVQGFGNSFTCNAPAGSATIGTGSGQQSLGSYVLCDSSGNQIGTTFSNNDDCNTAKANNPGSTCEQGSVCTIVLSPNTNPQGSVSTQGSWVLCGSGGQEYSGPYNWLSDCQDAKNNGGFPPDANCVSGTSCSQ